MKSGNIYFAKYKICYNYCALIFGSLGHTGINFLSFLIMLLTTFRQFMERMATKENFPYNNTLSGKVHSLSLSLSLRHVQQLILYCVVPYYNICVTQINST